MAAITDHGPAEPARDETAETAKAPYSAAYTGYITFVLALVFMLAAADRNIMAVLLHPIQKDLGVSDTAMGIMTGTVFSVVYATVALPLARIADRGHRRNLIAAAVAFWSAMTALCGVTVNYLTLLAARIGVAAGEAGYQPSILSMLGDLYPRRRRGIAVGLVSVGASLGIGLGAYLAGLINDRYGWRAAFLVLGIPGLVVGALAFLTVPEPPRGTFDGGAKPDPDHASFWRSVRYLASVPTVPRLLLAKIMLQLGFQGFLTWVTTFFIRVHDMTAAEAGALFGASVGIGGVASQLLAGFFSDLLARRGESWRSYWCTLSLLAGVPFMLMVILGRTEVAIVGLFAISIVTGGATTASLTAGLGVVRGSMRGFLTAVLLFCVQIFGMALGPMILGSVSDALKATHGEMAIRYSLLLVPLAWVLAALAFWWTGRTADRDAAIASGEAAPAR